MDSVLALVIVFSVAVFKLGWVEALGITAGIYCLMPYRSIRTF